MNYWALGFLWGSSRISGSSLLVQSKHQEMMEKVRDAISPHQKIFPVRTESGTSWRLKLYHSHAYVVWMKEHGYEGRNGNIERTIPEFDRMDDEADFLRGYFSVHYTLDSVIIKKRKITRLRFYAAYPILIRLTEHLHTAIGTGLKKPQNHGRNDVCKVLYYQAHSEVVKVCEYLGLEMKNPSS